MEHGLMASAQLHFWKKVHLGYSYNSAGTTTNAAFGNTNEIFIRLEIGRKKDKEKDKKSYSKELSKTLNLRRGLIILALHLNWHLTPCLFS